MIIVRASCPASGAPLEALSVSPPLHRISLILRLRECWQQQGKGMKCIWYWKVFILVIMCDFFENFVRFWVTFENFENLEVSPCLLTFKWDIIRTKSWHLTSHFVTVTFEMVAQSIGLASWPQFSIVYVVYPQNSRRFSAWFVGFAMTVRRRLSH
jgi:hypothetical protein